MIEFREHTTVWGKVIMSDDPVAVIKNDTVYLSGDYTVEQLRQILEAAQQSVEPTLDTSPLFAPQPCVVCGQMVCNH